MTANVQAFDTSGTVRRRVRGMGLRRWLARTPGRLRLFSVAILGALIALWAVGASSLNARHEAARSVGLESAPLLVAADDLYVALADADATASSAFLRAGLEPPEVRQRYLDDLADAGRVLGEISRRTGSAPTAVRAVRLINQELPIYTGRIEAARTNNRLSYPVGAAYMRQASGLMRTRILPAATDLYGEAARRLDRDLRAGTSSRQILWVAIVGILTIGLLVAAQIYTARRTNRILNIGVACASVLVMILLVWTLGRFVTEQDALVRSQREGSDSVVVLSAARLLTLQAQTNSSLALAEPGTGAAFLTEFDAVMRRLGGADGRGGLLGEAREIATRTSSANVINKLSGRFAEFNTVHHRVRVLDDGGEHTKAVALSLDEEAAASHRLNKEIRGTITVARRRFDNAATDARAGFSALAVALTAAILLGVVLTFIGLQRRIGEY